jgi:hypothetical protein
MHRLPTLAIACIESGDLAHSLPHPTMQYTGLCQCNTMKANASIFQSTHTDPARFCSKPNIFYLQSSSICCIYIPSPHLQTHLARSNSSICTSTVPLGNIPQGKQMHSSTTQSNVSLHKDIENARHTVSVSSAHQLFVRICKGEYRLKTQKRSLTKASTGSTTTLKTSHQRTMKMVHKAVKNCEKR